MFTLLCITASDSRLQIACRYTYGSKMQSIKVNHVWMRNELSCSMRFLRPSPSIYRSQSHACAITRAAQFTLIDGHTPQALHLRLNMLPPKSLACFGQTMIINDNTPLSSTVVDHSWPWLIMINNTYQLVLTPIIINHCDPFIIITYHKH